MFLWSQGHGFLGGGPINWHGYAGSYSLFTQGPKKLGGHLRTPADLLERGRMESRQRFCLGAAHRHQET